MIRRVAQVVAVAVALAGAVFALQGMRLLPSRIMYGRPEWILIGVLMVAFAMFILWRARRV